MGLGYCRLRGTVRRLLRSMGLIPDSLLGFESAWLEGRRIEFGLVENSKD